ncbi:MAG TPA: hypothetical protein VGH20_11770 [Myxococcales bacterium]|jgi:hypothetical protein
MKKFILAIALLLPSVASAQVFINFGWSAPPPLVEVSPGVQVVENSNEEVFFVDGRYWVERDGRWYWARDHHARWVMESRHVPVFLVRHHRGEYAHWRRADHFRRGEVRAVRHEVRAERREVRTERRDERRERREDRRDHRH